MPPEMFYPHQGRTCVSDIPSTPDSLLLSAVCVPDRSWNGLQLTAGFHDLRPFDIIYATEN